MRSYSKKQLNAISRSYTIIENKKALETLKNEGYDLKLLDDLYPSLSYKAKLHYAKHKNSRYSMYLSK